MAFSTQPESDPPSTSTTSTSPPNSSIRTPDLPPNLSTHTQLHSPTSLNASHHLPALVKLINKCFDISHNPPGHSYLPPSQTARLRNPEQLAQEIGPNGFTFLILTENTDAKSNESGSRDSKGSEPEALEERVIATASAKPFTLPHSPAPPSTPEAIFKRQPGTHTYLEPDAHLPQWEILVMAVDPALQGRGIAAQLMDVTVEEIKNRVRNATSRDGGGEQEVVGGKGRVMLLLSTMQEVNEAYYSRRGWSSTGVRRFRPGVLGSRDGFGVVEMGRCLEV